MYEIKRHHSATMQFLGLMLMATAVSISGCSSQTETTEVPVTPNPVVVEEPEPMSLAFASVSNARAMTRLSEDVVQFNNSASYRPISDFHFIALKTEESGTTVSNAKIDNQETVDKKDPETNKPVSRFYHFSYCDMAMGVNGSLVYAKAKDVVKSTEQEKKIYNGCLTESPYLSDYVYETDQISFEPVSIYSDAPVGADGIHEDARKLANALTEIARVEYEEAKWSTVNEKNLKSLYARFTNNGYDLAGSAASVRKWIEAVKAAAGMWSFLDGTPQEGIRKNIIAKATDLLDESKAGNIVSLDYPKNINLPDGAAVLRWADVEEGEGEDAHTVKKFVPQLHTTTLDDINSVSRFVYPPALYYYVESDLWTSNSKVTFDQYKDKSKWKGDSNSDANAVQTLFQAGGTITNNTKTVAIADPLQYAVAQLSLKVQVADGDTYATSLPYDDDKEHHQVAYVNGENNYFRLTGVIIGGQRTVGYNFKPVNNSDMDVKFVYDSQVPADFWLKQTSDQVFNTLVLESWEGEDLNVILEFEYTGAKEFKCLNGYVYPGTRFYLVGEIKLSTGTPSEGVAEDDKEDVRKRVFTQDRITSIQMTVSSLEKAYNVLPNIIAKNLEIGVQTTPQWKAAEPSDPVIME